MQQKRAGIGNDPNKLSTTTKTVGGRKEQFEIQELEKEK